MKITISGLSGTGTSTVGKLLATELGAVFMSGGNIFREMAEELGMSVYEFDEYVKTHPEYDEQLDARQKKFGEENNNFVFESRLAWFFIPDSFKVKLECELAERVRRIGEREEGNLDELRKKTLAREATYTPRYNKLYGIEDWHADENFDLIIDATSISQAEIVDIIKNKLNKN